MLMTMDRPTSEEPVGIVCPRCGCRHMKATSSDPQPRQTRFRYRECRHCGKVIRTKETVVTDNVQTRDSSDEFTP